MSRFHLVLISIILLSACAGAKISPSYSKFGSNSPEGIIVLGVEEYHRLTFGQYKIILGSINSDGSVNKRTKTIPQGFDIDKIVVGWYEPKKYHVAKLQSGSYFFKEIRFNAPAKNVIARLCLGTRKFEVPPGKIVYVGNVGFSRKDYGLYSGLPKIDEARAELKKYPNLPQELVLAETERYVPPPPCKN